MSYYSTVTATATLTQTFTALTTATVTQTSIVGGTSTASQCSTYLTPPCAPCFVDASSDIYSYPGGPISFFETATITVQPYVYTTDGTLTTSLSTVTPTTTISTQSASSHITYTTDITWITSNFTFTYPNTYIKYHDFVGIGATADTQGNSNSLAATCAQLGNIHEFSLPITTAPQSFLYTITGSTDSAIPTSIPAQILSYLDSFPAVVSQLGNQPPALCLPTTCITQPSGLPTSSSSSIITPSVCSTCALATITPGATDVTTILTTTYTLTVFTMTNYSSNQPYYSYSTQAPRRVSNTYTGTIIPQSQSQAPYGNSSSSGSVVSVCFNTCVYTTTLTSVTTQAVPATTVAITVYSTTQTQTPSSAATQETTSLSAIPGNPLGDDTSSNDAGSISPQGQPIATPSPSSPGSPSPGPSPGSPSPNSSPGSPSPSPSPSSPSPGSPSPNPSPGSPSPSPSPGSPSPRSPSPSPSPGSPSPSPSPGSPSPGSPSPGSPSLGSTAPGNTSPSSTASGKNSQGSSSSVSVTQTSCLDALCALTQISSPSTQNTLPAASGGTSSGQNPATEPSNPGSTASTSTVSNGAVISGSGATVTISQVGSGTFAVGSTTITAGQSATLANSQVVSVASTGGGLIGGSSATMTSVGTYYTVDGQTLTPGGVITESGTTVSLASGGTTYYVNGTPQPVGSGGVISLGSSSITGTVTTRTTAAGASSAATTSVGTYYTVDGQTLTPGGVITESGTTVSLASGGTTYYVNGTPQTVASGGVISLGTAKITGAVTTRTTTADVGGYITSGLGGGSTGIEPPQGAGSRNAVATAALSAVVMVVAAMALA